MRLNDSTLELSASDLTRFLGCRHRIGLDLAATLGQLNRPTWVDAALQMLQGRGREYERAYVATLAAQGFVAEVNATLLLSLPRRTRKARLALRHQFSICQTLRPGLRVASRV